MPAPLNVDREAVRVLAIAVGVREAARQMGLSEDAVMQWSKRYGWMTEKAAALERIPPGRGNNRVTAVSASVRNPSEAMAKIMEDLSGKTKLSALKYAARTTEHAAKVAEEDPESALSLASDVKSVLQTAQIAGGWAAAGGAVVNVAVGLRLEMD